MKTIGEIAVGRLNEGAGEDHDRAEHSRLRQREMELIDEQWLEGADGAGVEIDAEMAERVEDQGDHPGANPGLDRIDREDCLFQGGRFGAHEEDGTILARGLGIAMRSGGRMIRPRSTASK